MFLPLSQLLRSKIEAKLAHGNFYRLCLEHRRACNRLVDWKQAGRLISDKEVHAAVCTDPAAISLQSNWPASCHVLAIPHSGNAENASCSTRHEKVARMYLRIDYRRNFDIMLGPMRSRRQSGYAARVCHTIPAQDGFSRRAVCRHCPARNSLVAPFPLLSILARMRSRSRQASAKSVGAGGWWVAFLAFMRRPRVCQQDPRQSRTRQRERATRVKAPTGSSCTRQAGPYTSRAPGPLSRSATSVIYESPRSRLQQVRSQGYWVTRGSGVLLSRRQRTTPICVFNIVRHLATDQRFETTG